MRRTLTVFAVLSLFGGLMLSSTPGAAAPNPPAFPGAEGFGAGATGGRGGRVYIVNTLAHEGPGSLRAALDPAGSGLPCEPRIIVFSVSGIIEVPGKHDLEITCSNLTIAGQTAPGAGITVNGRIDSTNASPGGSIIIRHLRIRNVPIASGTVEADDFGGFYDTLTLDNFSRMMIDHVTLSWASDEVLHLFAGGSDATIQWSTIEESNLEGQPEGPHNYGIIGGPEFPRISIHHVLCAHHRSRCPALATGPAEFVNSVVYDVGTGFNHDNAAQGEMHVFGNTFVRGPSAELTPFLLNDEDGAATPSQIWLAQNQVIDPGVFEGVVDDIRGTPLEENAFSEGGYPEAIVSSGTDFATVSADYAPITQQSPAEAYELVLQRAGAWPRDTVTNRTIQEVRDRQGSWGVNHPGDLMTGLAPAAPPLDVDQDGMADEWESTHGLNPGDGTDHARPMDGGYTAIEVYINELADALVGGAPVVPPGPGDTPVGQAPQPTTQPTAAPGAPAPTAPRPGTPVSPASSGDGFATTTLLATFAALMSTVAAVLAGLSLYLVRQRDRRVRPPPGG